MTNRIKKRIADTFSMIAIGAVVIVLFVGAVYLSLSWQMAGYNEYVTCNPESNISKFEWLMGIRPYNDSCWH
jgi:hypothetical protein